MAIPMYYTITQEDDILLIWFKSQYNLKYEVSFTDQKLRIFFPYMSLQTGFEPESDPISITTNYKGLTADVKLDVTQKALLRKTDANTLVVTVI